ncbi:TRAMP complex RNA-binding subunit ASCRUDRAFT_38062, partial [Ascoidea rubescens DSM 1968]
MDDISLSDSELPLPKQNKDKVYSLSIDEVDDNPDELIDLRGQGRYFGNSEDSANLIICSVCHEPGHMRASCKSVICHSCGMLNDHYTQHCLKTSVCTNCGEKGHFRNKCTKQQRRIYCNKCDSRHHNSDRCPLIWRSYIVTNKHNEKVLPMVLNIYCYNCAKKGHYGDDCDLKRNSKVPNTDGSAFSGDNLPGVLRDKYWTALKKRNYDDYNY